MSKYRCHQTVSAIILLVKMHNQGFVEANNHVANEIWDAIGLAKFQILSVALLSVKKAGSLPELWTVDWSYRKS